MHSKRTEANEKKMNFYRTNGEYIYYEILGRGFPVVFLHGNNLDSRYFQKQRPLAKKLKLIFVDSLGHGKSGELSGEISFAHLADGLEELLSFLQIEKCLLVGHSDGANLAIEYAGRHGTRVAGILANSGNLRLNGLKFFSRYSCYVEEALYLVPGLVLPSFRRRARASRLLRKDVDIPAFAFRHADYPVLVLVGSHDLVKESHSREIAALFPRGRFCERRGQGHNIPTRDSAFFNRAVLEMVKHIQTGA